MYRTANYSFKRENFENTYNFEIMCFLAEILILGQIRDLRKMCVDKTSSGKG